MKTNKHIYSICILTVFAFLFYASATESRLLSKTETFYKDTHKGPEKIMVSNNIPIITPTSTTNQMQSKGGVIISVEIVPFKVENSSKGDSIITYADPEKRGFDIYEVRNTPISKINCEGDDQIKFRIRIRNNEQVPLILSQVGFILAIDGISYSFPDNQKKEWNEGLIITGEEKTYTIKGPEISGLYNAKVIRLFLNGVPTEYNEAGNVTKKNNFEWFFECKTQTVEKEEQITYSYPAYPIYKERCKKCNGTGTDPQVYQCSTCKGAGYTINIYDKKRYQCYTCKGTGTVHQECGNCNGIGIISYPKSTQYAVDKSVAWKGARVDVATNPPGAKVSVVNTKTGEYNSIGMSNLQVDWYSSNEKSYPIIIEYQGKSVQVLPYNLDGKLIFNVEVDFLGISPIVKKGRQVD
jgi:hypothetical protein